VGTILGTKTSKYPNTQIDYFKIFVPSFIKCFLGRFNMKINKSYILISLFEEEEEEESRIKLINREESIKKRGGPFAKGAYNFCAFGKCIPAP
jgi:hypothetical protein